MHRRPTHQEVHNSNTANGHAPGAGQQREPVATSVNTRLTVRRNSRAVAVGVLVLFAVNLLAGSAIALRDTLRYGYYSRWHLMWIMQSVLVVYVVFGIRWFNPLPRLIPSTLMTTHSRTVVLFVLVKALVLAAILLYALAQRLFVQWPSSVRRQGFIAGALFTLPTIWGWQMTLICVLIVCIVLADYYDVVFPPSLSTSAASSRPTPPLPTAAPTMPTSSLAPTDVIISKPPDACYYYYHCRLSDKRMTDSLAFSQPLYLLLSICPLSVDELRRFVVAMHEQHDYRPVMMVVDALYKDRSARLVKRRLIQQLESVYRAEAFLVQLDDTRVVLESELQQMLYSLNSGRSQGLKRDLSALHALGHIEGYEAHLVHKRIGSVSDDDDDDMDKNSPARLRQRGAKALLSLAIAWRNSNSNSNGHVTV